MPGINELSVVVGFACKTISIVRGLMPRGGVVRTDITRDGADSEQANKLLVAKHVS